MSTFRASRNVRRSVRVALLVLAACSASPNPPETKGISARANEALKSAMGMSVADFSALVERRQLDWTANCVRASGFDVSSSDLPAPTGALIPDTSDYSSVFGSTSRRILESYEQSVAQERSGSLRSTAPSPRGDAIDQCLERSGEAVPNPLLKFSQWMADKSADARLKELNSQRVVDARAGESRCLSDLGYPQSDATELSNSFADRAQDIIEMASNGEIESTQAISMLGEVVADEESIAAQVVKCLTPRLQAEKDSGRIASEKFFEENSDLMAEQLQILRDEARRLANSPAS